MYSELIQGQETDYQSLNWFQSYDRKRKNLKIHYIRDFFYKITKKRKRLRFV